MIILEKVDWKDGLLNSLATDAEVSARPVSGGELSPDRVRTIRLILTALKLLTNFVCLCAFRPESSVTSKIFKEDKNCNYNNCFEFS